MYFLKMLTMPHNSFKTNGYNASPKNCCIYRYIVTETYYTITIIVKWKILEYLLHYNNKFGKICEVYEKTHKIELRFCSCNLQNH